MLVPAGARWDCRGCAKCCHHHVLGPVEPEIVRGIESFGVEKLWPDGDGRPWVVQQDRDTGEGAYLEKVDGHCVFLQPDGGCAVHAAMGAAAKPGFCREYPFTVMREPRGVSVTVREGCGGAAESSLDGRLLEDHAQEVLDLPRAYPIPTFSPKHVVLVPGLGVELDDWIVLEDALVNDVLEHDRQPAAHMAAMRALVLRSVRRPVTPPVPEKVTQATEALLHVFGLVLDDVLQNDGGSPAEQAFSRRLLGNVARARAMLPLGVPELDRSGRDFASLIIRSFLLGKRFAQDGGVAAGLGLLLHSLHTSALASGVMPGQPVSAEALSVVFSDHVRLIHNRSLQPIRKKARPALVDMFLHAV